MKQILLIITLLSCLTLQAEDFVYEPITVTHIDGIPYHIEKDQDGITKTRIRIDEKVYDTFIKAVVLEKAKDSRPGLVTRIDSFDVFIDSHLKEFEYSRTYLLSKWERNEILLTTKEETVYEPKEGSELFVGYFLYTLIVLFSLAILVILTIIIQRKINN